MSMSRNKLRKLFSRAHAAHQRGELDVALAGYARIFGSSKPLNDFLGRVADNLDAADVEAVGHQLRDSMAHLDETYGAALHYGAIAARQLWGAAKESKMRTAEQLAQIDATADRLMALSIMLAPTNPAALFNFAKSRQDKGDLSSARHYYRAAARYAPHDAHIWAKLGDCLMDAGQAADALAAWRFALQSPPTAPDTAYNLSFLYLLLGDFERGLVLHEMRWQCPDFVHANGRKALRAPYVQRGDDIAGRTVLVRHEQGNGDQIQMARFVHNLRAAGAAVVIETQQGLVRLFRACFPDLPVVGLGDDIPAHDAQVPYMSLPWLFMQREAEIPAPLAVPPLPIDGKLASTVARLRTIAGKRVGIAWAGSSNHVNDAKRSASPAFLDALANVPGVTWINLQLGPRADEFARLGDARLNAARAIADFADTAALMQHLDAVVTVDTGVAHLAGSVGVPTFIALPFNAEWRWMRERADSPWYPSARLLRQAAPGDWGSVAAQLRDAFALAVAA